MTGPDSPDALPAFDPAVMEEMAAGLSRESLAPVLQTFIEETRSRVDQLDAALAARDWSTVELHAHSLKSTAATFGAPALRALSLALEEAAASGDPDSVHALCAQMRPMAGAALAAVEAYIAAPGD